MSGEHGNPAGNRRSALWRDVLVMVLAGSALGAGYNQLQLREGPGRGLTWIRQERRLASLESLLPATPPRDSVLAPAAPTHASPAVAAVPSDPGPRRAPRDTTLASRASSAEIPPPAPAAVSPPPPAASTTPAAAALPAIPDTREPVEVGTALVVQLHAAGAALFVDARTPGEFAEGHIAGAVNLPFDDVFRKPDLARSLDSGGRPVVTYCGGGDCELSRNLAFALIEGGHRKVLVYLGGTAGWKDAGQALVTGAGR